MSESRTAGVRRVEFDVDWPPGHVACYLLDADEPVLFDAGTPDGMTGGDEHETLREGVAAAGYELADIEHLVVTHPHVDHIGQVETVIEAADPTVYAPAGVRDRFAGGLDGLAERVRANAARAGLDGDALDRAVSAAVESLERNRELLPPEDVDVWVEAGTTEIGSLTAEAIPTPGHQADHLAYRLEQGGESLLVSGDSVIEPFRAVVLHDGLDDGYADAFSSYFDALDQLDGYDPDRVYPGHGPVHDQFTETIARDRGSLDRRLDGVVELVGDGHETAPEVAAALSGDRDMRYMLAETLSALAHLEREGRIAAETVDGVRRYA